MIKAVAISAGLLGPGGVETHIRITSLVLRSAGVPVSIFGTGCHWQPKTVRQLKEAGVKFVLPPAFLSRWPKFGALWAAAYWRLNPPRQATCLYAIGAGKSHGWLKSLTGPDTFSIYHEIVSPPGPDSPATECLQLMDGAIANSHLVAREMAALCPQKPIRVIPFLTADIPVVPPPTRPAIGFRPLQIGYLGRLEERKQPQVLVHEWKRITTQSKVGRAVLHVYGDDYGTGLRREMEDLVTVQSMHDWIQFHGTYAHSALPEILFKLDLVVLPSKWEGLPLVLVEAMQHGVPVVATAVGGTVELGENNPDVTITGPSWTEFERGLVAMCAKIRAGEIDARRLHRWAETRYGYAAVAPQWLQVVTHPHSFFGSP